MLLELIIKDFAIIEGLTLGFGPGLHVFTGETGAGKSIIMDALGLVLGDRASLDLIRSGRDEALVEAVFDVSGIESMKPLLEEAGLTYDENLIIKRVIQRNGRNRVYINGSPATIVTLSEVGRRLVDICGQSGHQSLARPEEQIDLLDGFGGYDELRKEMKDAYKRWRTLKRELEGFLKDTGEIEKRKELLAFQAAEVGDAALRPEEEDELLKERDVLRNSERIRTITDGAQRTLYSDDGSVTERLGAVLKELKEISRFDKRLEDTARTLEEALCRIEDASVFLRDYSSSVEFYPAALEEIEQRLDLIHRLKKKYSADTVEELLRKKDEWERELDELDAKAERLHELEDLIEEARDRAVLVANRLSEERNKAAARLRKKCEAEMRDLGMEGAVFEVLLDREHDAEGGPRFTEKGADKVTFLISTNPGEEVKPLSRVASGGELSRIMLSLKNVTASGRVSTLVFDEVDSGVGGRMAHVVGRKLKAVAMKNQVICITHLPQIAAFADLHYFVSKERTPEGRTVTTVRELKGEERVEDIAKMLGGSRVTDSTRKHAIDLMEEAQRSFSS